MDPINVTFTIRPGVMALGRSIPDVLNELSLLLMNSPNVDYVEGFTWEHVEARA
jgi:hypothetical protein